MADHAGLPFSVGGFLGVDIFFVLSGFLITTLLIEEWQQRGDISLRNFYVRRGLRLLPALFVLLGVLIAYSALKAPVAVAAELRRAVLYALFYVANWAVVYRVPLGFLDHTWSLSIEEQFYLLWAPLLYLCLRVTRGLRLVTAVVVAGIVGPAVLRMIRWDGEVSAIRLYFGTDTRIDGLMVGAAVSLLACSGLLSLAERQRRLVRWAGAVSFVLILFLYTSAIWDAWYMYWGVMSLVSIATALLIVEILTGPSRLTRAVLGSAVAVWIGRVSYGLYLWHFPVFKFITPERLGLTVTGDTPGLHLAVLQLARFAATFAVVTLSFYAIEQPALRLRHRFRSRS
jgi:peptidoglycan/LPS O-acetylase OafA/YrhL